MSYLILGGAIILIIIAHLLRVYRWGLFINIYEKPQANILIRAIGIGYIINYFVPFKFGDLIRAWYASRKMRTGKALALSTVIVDRYLDIIVVGIVFVVLSLGDKSFGWNMLGTAKFYIGISAVLLIIALLVFTLRNYVKRAIVFIARFFNEKIENSILRFSFALISNFKDVFQKINSVKLITSTCLMWLFYIGSYYTFANFLSVHENTSATWVSVFSMLFSQNSIKSSTGNLAFLNNLTYGGISISPYYMLIYMGISLLLLFIFSFVIINKEEEPLKYDDAVHYINLLPQMDHRERLIFLENYFSSKNREYILNYLELNQGISIIRDYSAGSNATTMLCMDKKKTFFRKYAFGLDGDKLYEQILWIEVNKNRIALPEILKQGKTEFYCYYDMPYNSHAVGLFEYVHTMPIEKSWNIIRRTLECLDSSIYKINIRKADEETILKYIQNKVNKNLAKIKKAKRIGNLQQYEILIINGVEYKNLAFYENFLSEDYLTTIFKNDNYAVIHGDLTIENIICTRGEDGRDDFYIIDPNTGNIHDSPNLDYGKLLQSIHGGYEFLMSTKEVSIDENRINFLFTKSMAYTELHNFLRDYMQNIFGMERTRSIYFHEIIHWIRLLPYKIEKDSDRSLLFYAGMLMVMNDVVKMYGEI